MDLRKRKEFPTEALRIIISQLPIEDVSRLRSVNKYWCRVCEEHLRAEFVKFEEMLKNTVTDLEIFIKQRRLKETSVNTKIEIQRLYCLSCIRMLATGTNIVRGTVWQFVDSNICPFFGGDLLAKYNQTLRYIIYTLRKDSYNHSKSNDIREMTLDNWRLSQKFINVFWKSLSDRNREAIQNNPIVLATSVIELFSTSVVVYKRIHQIHIGPQCRIAVSFEFEDKMPNFQVPSFSKRLKGDDLIRIINYCISSVWDDNLNSSFGEIWTYVKKKEEESLMKEKPLVNYVSKRFVHFDINCKKDLIPAGTIAMWRRWEDSLHKISANIKMLDDVICPPCSRYPFILCSQDKNIPYHHHYYFFYPIPTRSVDKITPSIRKDLVWDAARDTMDDEIGNSEETAETASSSEDEPPTKKEKIDDPWFYLN